MAAYHDHALSLVECMKSLTELGLNTGRAGNASVRIGDDQYLITPSGVHPRDLRATQMVTLDLNQAPHLSPNNLTENPSSEWRMHHDIYLAYSEVRAVIHTHSSAATALACLGERIPAFHYMVAVAGGDSIECAPYATFGSEALSQNAVKALHGRSACLLANHGLITTGQTVLEAVDLAQEVEQLSFQYLMCLSSGKPTILNTEQMSLVIEKFKNYGKRTG
ncbi:MAG: class II aldolase/adducin family protein [Pseudomonadota bacterium]